MISPPIIEILLISIALGFDSFSVALASGTHGLASRRVFRMGWHFGLFQFIMPIIGWSVGEIVAGRISAYGNWIVFSLLLVIGGKMVWEGVKNNPEKIPDLSKGWNLILMSISTSIDALAIGFSFRLLDYEILRPAAVIGIICFIMTGSGLYLGVKFYDKLKHRAIVLGGIILIVIGVKSLF